MTTQQTSVQESEKTFATTQKNAKSHVFGFWKKNVKNVRISQAT